MVFEYLPDVPGALREVHRVLKPGGRVAIHGCAWGATLWRSSDPARMANMLAVWDNHLEDKALPQTLNTKLREAGFRQGDHAIYVMFNPVLNENTYSHWLIEFVRAYNASQGVAEEEIDAWTDDLRRLGAAGDYFYSQRIHHGGLETVARRRRRVAGTICSRIIVPKSPHIRPMIASRRHQGGSSHGLQE